MRVEGPAHRAVGRRRHTHLVVVGSSAGGITALLRLLGRLTPPFPAPIVLAQHLDPSRSSGLAQVLASRSSLPVQTVEGRVRLEPGVVYVTPSNSDVAVTDGTVALYPPSGRSRPSVDRLFGSAATVYGPRLIAVVLSGTGSDGAGGARRVHYFGGKVIVQNPETAQFPGMPRAVDPGDVDVVADLDDIPPILGSILGGASAGADLDRG